MPGKNILLAVVGTSPQIVTLCLYALYHEEKTIIDEVHCITTGIGRDGLSKTIFKDDAENPVKRLYEEHFEEGSAKYSYRRLLYNSEENSINCYVLTDEGGLEILDIRNDKDNDHLMKLCFDKAYTFTENEEDTVHFLIAGGRKTMASCLTLAAQYYARIKDRILHVLTSPAEKEDDPDFFFPLKEEAEDISIHLIDLGIRKYRDSISDEQGIIPKPETLLDVIDARRHGKLKIDLPNKSISFMDETIIFENRYVLGPMELATYTLIAWLTKYRPSHPYLIREDIDPDNSLFHLFDKINETIPRPGENIIPFEGRNTTNLSRDKTRINSSFQKFLTGNYQQLIGIETSTFRQREKQGEMATSAYTILLPSEQIEIIGLDPVEEPIAEPLEQINKIVVLCVVGMSPQVITEFLYATINDEEENHHLTDGTEIIVHCITTGIGKKQLEENIVSENENNKIKQMLEEIGRDDLKISVECTILKDERGDEIEDLETSLHNEILLRECLNLSYLYARKITSRYKVYFLIAGGRKTMSACLTTAAHYYSRSQDRIYHVLVSPPGFEECSDFWFPTSVDNAFEITNTENQVIGFSDQATIELVRLHHQKPLQLPKKIQEPPYHFPELYRPRERALLEGIDGFVTIYIEKREYTNDLIDIAYEGVSFRKGLKFSDTQLALYLIILLKNGECPQPQGEQHLSEFLETMRTFLDSVMFDEETVANSDKFVDRINEVNIEHFLNFLRKMRSFMDSTTFTEEAINIIADNGTLTDRINKINEKIENFLIRCGCYSDKQNRIQSLLSINRPNTFRRLPRVAEEKRIIRNLNACTINAILLWQGH